MPLRGVDDLWSRLHDGLAIQCISMKVDDQALACAATAGASRALAALL